MKNYSDIYKELFNYYKETFSKEGKFKVEVILRTEIILYVLENLGLQGKNINNAWGLLSGYHFNGKSTVNLSKEKLLLINKARGFLIGIYGSTAFKATIDLYKDINEVNNLLYKVICKNNEIYFYVNNSNKLDLRKNKIKNIFENDIKIQKNNIKVFRENQGVIINDGLGEIINFNKCAKEIEILTKESVKNGIERSSIVVNKQNLLKTAEYIDSRIHNKNYVQRVKNISFDVINDNDIVLDDEITINGLFNLVGRVGAGKSTLVEVLTCKLALEGKKTALVVDSIKAIVELLDYFDKLNIKAVPVWGYTGKETRKRKAYSSIEEEDFSDIKSTTWNKWFSETCILDGLRDSSDILDAFEDGKEPCLKILKNKKSREKYACPYYNICPSHLADLELKNAQVYITTPAAFLKTKISPVIYNGNVRVSEFLYYNCDLVIFDESDRVQLNFEQSFTEHLVLMDHSEESYLNKLGKVVESWYYKNRLINASDKTIQDWYDYFTNTQRISNILIQILNNNKMLIKKLNGTFSTALSLHGRFIEGTRLEENKIKYKELSDFIAKGEKKLDKEANSIRMEVLAGNIDYKSIETRISKWYFNDEVPTQEEIIMIEFIFILNIFEKNFRAMVNGLDEIIELNNLQVENASIFYRGIEDYLPFIPTAPTGNKFGIRVTADSNNNLKRLVIFKSMGLGRWLITNYHNMYELIDNVKGPNVLLLSGTSWAPNSYAYHIDIKVDAILNGNESEALAIEESEFIFEPIIVDNEAVVVSGTDLYKRIEKIKTIVSHLVKPSIRSKKSKLSIELDRLESDRKRILLLVGSYDEAAALKIYMDSILTNVGDIKKSDISLLIRDDSDEISDEDISRGDVTEFGLSDKKILIAPLMSLERGYNILNVNNKAAIGSVYFLIRPMPIPNDISIVVNKINSNSIRELNRKNSKDLIEHNMWVKSNRDKSLSMMQTLLIKSERLGYRQLEEYEREALCMTLFVTMCQVIGRLIRGGCKARVHFCDAKFAPNTI